MSSWLETWRLLNKIVHEGEVFPLATRKAHRKVTQSDTHVNPTRHYLRTIELKISRNNGARPRVGWVNEKLLFIVIEKLETNMRRAEFLLPWPCVQCRRWTKTFFIDITPGSLSLRLPAWAGNRNGFYRRTNDNAAVSRKKLLIELSMSKNLRRKSESLMASFIIGAKLLQSSLPPFCARHSN